MNDGRHAELLAAILDLRDATALGFASVDRRFEETDGRIDQLRADMNRRFDRVDDRFDAFEHRVAALE